MPAYQLDVNKEYISSLFRDRSDGLKDLVKKVGISHQTFRNIEQTGKTSRNTLMQIAKYFNVPFDQLLRGGSLQYSVPSSSKPANEPESSQYRSTDVTIVKDLLNTYLDKIDKQLTEYKGNIEGRNQIIIELKKKITELESELQHLKSK